MTTQSPKQKERSTMPTTIPTTPSTASRSLALSHASDIHNEIFRIAGLVDSLLVHGSYGHATMEFIDGFRGIAPSGTNWLYEWWLSQVQTTTLTMAVHAHEDDDHALDVPLEWLASYRAMYLACFGTDTGFLRILLRTADVQRLDNDVYAAMILLCQSLSREAEK